MAGKKHNKWLIAFGALAAISIVCSYFLEPSEELIVEPLQPAEEVAEPAEIDYPEFIATDYEKAIFEVVNSYDGTVAHFDYNSDSPIVTIHCKNSHSTFDKLLTDLHSVVAVNGDDLDLVVVLTENEGQDFPVLANAVVHPDGTHEFVSASPDYDGYYRVTTN